MDFDTKNFQIGSETGEIGHFYVWRGVLSHTSPTGESIVGQNWVILPILKSIFLNIGWSKKIFEKIKIFNSLVLEVA